MQRLLIIGLFLAFTVSFASISAAGGNAPPPTVKQAEAANDAKADTDVDKTEKRSTLKLYTGTDVAVIHIEGMIYDYTLQSLKRRTNKALNNGATVIVIELDTPGGMLDAALDISKFIKSLNVPTVAWINNDAYSAGILIAAACDEIVMAKSAATGDCAPILPGQNLAPTERDKALQPLLAEFRDSAKENGYDYALFHAMCELGVEVFLIENIDNKERKLVNQVDYAVMVKGEDLQEADDAASKVKNSAGSLGVARLSVATEADRGKWIMIERIAVGKLLTLTQTEAEKAGLSKATIDSEAALRTYLSASTLTYISDPPTAKIAYWLTQPWVRGILVIVMMLGLYFELQAPGLGFPGAIGGFALVLLIGAPFLIGLGEIWHLLVVLVGVALFLVELFITPGFAVIGIAGIICIFGGLAMMVVPSGGSGLPAPEMQGLLINSVISMMFGLLGAVIGFFLVLENIDRIPGLSELVLKAQPAGAPVTASEQIHVSGDEALGHGQLKIGDTGSATTPLRPTGRADYDGQIIDVVSLGEWIETGDKIKVVEVHGNRIVVEKI